MKISAKISGLHWWYDSNSHAAELTAGALQVHAWSRVQDSVSKCMFFAFWVGKRTEDDLKSVLNMGRPLAVDAKKESPLC